MYENNFKNIKWKNQLPIIKQYLKQVFNKFNFT